MSLSDLLGYLGNGGRVARVGWTAYLFLPQGGGSVPITVDAAVPLLRVIGGVGQTPMSWTPGTDDLTATDWRERP